jgi:hypothetical protein
LVDGDADPTAEPRKPVLALGTIFGEPGAGGFRDQIASPPGRVACEPQPSLRVRRSVDVGAPWPADELPVKIERSVVGRTRISPLPPERMRFEGFDVFGRELPNWRLSRRAKLGGARDGLAGGLLAKLSRVGGVESADLALQSARPQVVVSIWRAPDDPGKIIRIESIECVDSRNAHQRMLRAAADIENPGLEVWDRGVVDESALRLPDGSLAMFTRGNHAHVLRTIGPKAVDVTGEANMLDDWLMRSGEPDEAAAPAPANVPVWLRTHVGAPPALARYRVTPGSERH